MRDNIGVTVEIRAVAGEAVDYKKLSELSVWNNNSNNIIIYDY